jgi:alpha-glucosidase
MTSVDPTARPWWEPGVIYQVYPRSFQDSNDDGIGDLPGITARLEHLEWLGIDAVWISPIFPSPMADFGYDVADYVDIDPIFGSLADFDRLVEAAHVRGIRLLLDFVPNHSSDAHAWFVESRSSRANPKRDWYLWADPAPGGGPPNNWLSVFGGSAWEWDEPTGQFYYHAFLKEQPDLNWRNPGVRAEMYDVLRFWLDRGVDGFRVDVMWHLVKDDRLRDNPMNPDFDPEVFPRSFGRLLPIYTTDLPETMDIVREMRAVLDEYGDRVLIGEIYLPNERLVAYYGSGPDEPGAHLPFNFRLILTPWRAGAIGAVISEYEAALPSHGWPNWVLGNHDQARIASRVGGAQARVAAMLLLTLRGTPTLYYGEELGMRDVSIPRELEQDPARFDGPSGGRDPERTPMRWDGSPGAGFTSGEPWLPMGGDLDRINVAVQRDARTSMLTLYRELLALRKAEPALSVGAWSLVAADGDVLAYERRAGERRLVVALNLGHEPLEFRLPAPGRATALLSTRLDRNSEAIEGTLQLWADEGVILAMADTADGEDPFAGETRATGRPGHPPA